MKATFTALTVIIALTSTPSLAGALPTLTLSFSGRLAGTCVQTTSDAMTCEGDFNGVIDRTPVQTGFQLVVQVTGPGSLPGTSAAIGDFALDNVVPFVDIAGALRALDRAGIIRLDLRSELEIFASIFIDDNDGGVHGFEGVAIFGD